MRAARLLFKKSTKVGVRKGAHDMLPSEMGRVAWGDDPLR